MLAKEFQKFLDRDLHCLHCGRSDDQLIPQHRINRGMGGSKTRNRPSNIIVLCSLVNGLIESDTKMAATAKEFGWKLAPWDEPTEMPVWDVQMEIWWMLDDQGNRRIHQTRQSLWD